MRNFKQLALLFITLITLTACSNNDDSHPVNEEELITKATLVFKSTTTNDEIVLTFEDLDGDGPDDPTYTSEGFFDVNQIYNGEITLSNPLIDSEDINEEIQEEAEDHQFFYIPSNGFSGVFEYLDFDKNGNPLGLKFRFTPDPESQNGKLTLILKHLPSKNAEGVAEGNVANSGGSTDLEIHFPVFLESPTE